MVENREGNIMHCKEPLMETKLLNAGLLALVDVDGGDMTAVQAARTSYRDFEDKHTDIENENLVDYMMRHNHSTPFEFSSMTFYCVMPIFVARQWVRHRTASINEESLRYVEARKEFWIPSREEVRSQSKTNKQGSGENLTDEHSAHIIETIVEQGKSTHLEYEYLIECGLSKELSRTVLPVGQYTAWYWKANLRNTYHFLQLRCDPHAQYQIRVYANAMLQMVEQYFPVTTAAWKNHVLNAVTFSANEWDCVVETLDWFNVTDKSERYGRNYIQEITNRSVEKGIRQTVIKELIIKLETYNGG